MLFGCAAMSTTVHLDTAIPLDSVVIARFSFEYGGIVRLVDEDDEEDSSQIGGIIPGIVSAVNWISEMNQLSLIQAEMSDASRENWKKRLDEMYEAFEGRLYYDLNLPVMTSEDIGGNVMRNDWGRRASKINANWFFSSEPFDTNWPSTPSQLFVDALETLITDTLKNQVSKN